MSPELGFTQDKLTVLSFGAGQESTRFLHQLATDKEYYAKHIVGRLLVVGSDTGDEHGHTHANINHIMLFCFEHGIEFHWITPEMGFHPKTWQSLTGQYKRNSTIGSAAYQQTCTDNLKVKVVDNFVEYWIGRTYNYHLKRKNNYKAYCKENGKIRLIIGYAKGEESRTTNGNKFDPPWKKETVERYYPLIIDGDDRQACIDYNEANISWKVWPSNCKRCFYQSDQEILWLYRNERADFDEWVEIEKAKLKRFAHKGDKNYGVYGKITLEQKLEKAIKLYGHWTDEQLNEYKFSHGHCIKSKY